MLINHLDKKSFVNFDFLKSRGLNITFVNSYSYLQLRKSTLDFDKLDGFFYDGFMMVIFVRLFLRKPIRRVSFDMTSLAPKVFEYLSDTASDVIFVGAKQNEIEKFIKVIKDNYPKLKVSGYRNGYFDDTTLESFKHDIVSKQPSVLIAGMGTPIQEKFLIDLKNIDYKGIGFTCGGFIHQTSEKLHYYPNLINKYNLRWLYRLYDEPKLISRFIKSYFLFPFLFVMDFINFKFFHVNNSNASNPS